MPHEAPAFALIHKAAIQARNTMKRRRRKHGAIFLEKLRSNSRIDSRHLDLLSAKEASAWLTALPLQAHGFLLSKRNFRDAVALRYNWQLEAVPVTCICGTAFSADSAMTCTFGGYPTVRHNKLHDFVAGMLSEVCHDVAVEPLLTSSAG